MNPQTEPSDVRRKFTVRLDDHEPEEVIAGCCQEAARLFAGVYHADSGGEWPCDDMTGDDHLTVEVTDSADGAVAVCEIWGEAEWAFHAERKGTT